MADTIHMWEFAPSWRHGQVVRQRIANPLSPVRIWVPPLKFKTTGDEPPVRSPSRGFSDSDGPSGCVAAFGCLDSRAGPPREPEWSHRWNGGSRDKGLRGSTGGFGKGPAVLTSPDGLGRGMQGALQFAHQPLQAFASASGRRQMIRNHSRMAKIQQKSGLFGGKAQEVLIVVVDDFHQVCKQHLSFVGRNRGTWMGKAVNAVERCSFCPPCRWALSEVSGCCMQVGGDLHHHQPEQGHGNQERAWVGHVTTTRWT
jgi:hypothetical protein